jgi:hypothetical protein
MEQLIYKLDLPPFQECILEGIDNKFFHLNHKNHYVIKKPEDIFKPEFLTFKNFKWIAVLIFLLKSNTSNAIHADSAYPKKFTDWGINWIYKGDGLMDYWDLDTLKNEDVKYVVDRQGDPLYHWTTAIPPQARYLLKPGAYLVNTSVPHRATGIQDRYCISYRSDIRTTPWCEIVNIFKDNIIDEKINF